MAPYLLHALFSNCAKPLTWKCVFHAFKLHFVQNSKYICLCIYAVPATHSVLMTPIHSLRPKAKVAFSVVSFLISSKKFFFPVGGPIILSDSFAKSNCHTVFY